MAAVRGSEHASGYHRGACCDRPADGQVPALLPGGAVYSVGIAIRPEEVQVSPTIAIVASVTTAPCQAHFSEPFERDTAYNPASMPLT